MKYLLNLIKEVKVFFTGNYHVIIEVKKTEIKTCTSLVAEEAERQEETRYPKTDEQMLLSHNTSSARLFLETDKAVIKLK